MENNNSLDFTIPRLGEPCVDTPIQLSYVLGDFVPNFVEDSKKILYDPYIDTKSQKEQRTTSLLSFEVAGPRDRIFFDPSKTRAAIVTCGGLCPGLNDVIRGLVLALNYQYGVENIDGIRYGYAGMVEETDNPPIELTPHLVSDWHTRGGTELGSSRGPQPVEKMVDFLQTRGINLLFTVGGDGTQKGALALVEEINKRGLEIAVVGIPKTIDNDIQFVEKSFGVETAYSIATDVFMSAHAEATGAHNGIAIVKLMGRQSGFLAAMASVASGEVNFTLIPEVPFELEPPKGFLAALEKRIQARKHAVVAVAEGAGQDLLKKEGQSQERDASGNLKLGDIGTFLYERTREYFNRRNIEANVKYIDPSYIVRSLRAIPSDRMFCLILAQNAVHAAMSGRTGMIVGYWNSVFTHVPIEAAVSERKNLDPEGDLWLAVHQTTGQPRRMINM